MIESINNIIELINQLNQYNLFVFPENQESAPKFHILTQNNGLHKHKKISQNWDKFNTFSNFWAFKV